MVNEGFHVVIFDNRDIGKSEWLTQEPGFISFIKLLPEWFIEYFVDFTLSFMFDETGRFNMANPAPAEYDLNDMAKDGIAILDRVGKQKAHKVGASLERLQLYAPFVCLHDPVLLFHLWPYHTNHIQQVRGWPC